jgi:hypothetical protein
MFIPDPTFSIRSPDPNFSILDPDPYFLPIPDQGSKRHRIPGTGSGFATLNFFLVKKHTI